MHQILTMKAPGNIPVTYIDSGRYTFLLKTKQYLDLNTKEIVSLNNQIWLPLYPANLFWEFMPVQRKTEYINRQLNRHSVKRGWVDNANEKAYGYWIHKNYESALNRALSRKFQIKIKIEYGDYKAILYDRKQQVIHILKTIRVHQCLKNTPLFVPELAGHKLSNQKELCP